MKLIRFGVSLPEQLIKEFDTLIKKKNYSNRSEAIRDLIRKDLVQEEIDKDADVAGGLNILYDHHKPTLTDKLNVLQHDYYKSIISTTHIHLDAHNCLEVLVVRGKSAKVKEIADRLISTKGVKHGKLIMTTTGSHLH